MTSDTGDFGRLEATDLLVGASVTIDAYSVGAFYGRVLSDEGNSGLKSWTATMATV